MLVDKNESKKNIPTRTVGRGKQVRNKTEATPSMWADDYIHATCGDSLDAYTVWPTPTTIVSDGAYGILGFEGDTSDHLGIPEWYEPHIAAWSMAATPQTTLWFWNSEIGWAVVHPILEKYGWRYVNANIWNKGKGHIAGNVNTQKIRRFPVVTEVCVLTLMDWLIENKDKGQFFVFTRCSRHRVLCKCLCTERTGKADACNKIGLAR